MNINDLANLLAPQSVKNMLAAQAAQAAAPAPAAGASGTTNMALNGSEVGKGPAQTAGGLSNSVTRPIGIDYNIFQGSADGATGDSSGSATGTAGSVGAGVGTAAGEAGATANSGEGDGGSPGMAYGGRVKARYYDGGGSVVAPSAQAATTPEEAARRLREIYGDPQSSGTTTTETQSGGNPNDYIGQWASDIGQGNIIGMFEGPGMRALQKGDVLSAISPGVMIGKSVGLFKADGGPINANEQMGQHLADQGRGRDTMLVHMSPAEVQGLGSLHPSGRMPVNPNTGLPEADFLTDVLPGIAGTLIGSVVGMPWLGAAIGGLGTWAATGNLGKGILSGLMSFGLGSIGGQLAEAGAEAAGTAAKGAEAATNVASESGVGAAMDTAAKGGAGVLDPSKMVSTSSIDRAINPSLGSVSSNGTGFFDKISSGFQNAPQTLNNIGQGIMNPQNLSFSKMMMPGAMAASGMYGLYNASNPPPSAPNPMMPQQAAPPPLTTAANPPRIPTGGVVPAGQNPQGYQGELQYFAPNPSWGGYPSYAATGGQMAVYDTPHGGKYELARGGVAQLPSGMIRGPGAGMDDKIKGSIDGRRDVYLSDGEYVVDAQTISALGDGSSEAGAKRMKNVVEEIRQKKFGSKKQPPKMAETGGLASLGGV